MIFNKPPIPQDITEWGWKHWFHDLFNDVITPSFLVYRTSDQTGIATATPTKIQFDNEQHDTHDYWDKTTDYRFTPRIKGYYFFNCFARWNYDVAAGTDAGLIYIYKNGTSIAQTVWYDPADAPLRTTMNVSTIIYLDGVSDYIEFFVRQSSGSNQPLQGDQKHTYAFGFKISGP